MVMVAGVRPGLVAVMTIDGGSSPGPRGTTARSHGHGRQVKQLSESTTQGHSCCQTAVAARDTRTHSIRKGACGSRVRVWVAAALAGSPSHRHRQASTDPPLEDRGPAPASTFTAASNARSASDPALAWVVRMTARTRPWYLSHIRPAAQQSKAGRESRGECYEVGRHRATPLAHMHGTGTGPRRMPTPHLP